MAEENKSQLISEAELIEAINEDTLVSISLGAGQPQKNVKLSTLASVVAGLIGTATSSKDGLQLKDVAFKSLTRAVNGNSELNLGYVNGLVFIRNRSSSFRYLLFFCSKGNVTPIVNVETIPQSLAYNENGELIFTNGSSSNRSITIYWMSLPDIS